MSKHKSKQEILDAISKKEFFDEKDVYSDFFLGYDNSYEFYDHYEHHFDMWLNDPQRLRDEKLDKLLNISKKDRIGDFFPKDFGSK